MKNNLTEDIESINWSELESLAQKSLEDLFPICRSLTGEGVRRTLSYLQNIAPFKTKSIISGTKCFDWEVPKEWNISDGYILSQTGKKIVDFQKNNLHVVSYSHPIKKILTFDELRPHLQTLPNLPNAIPYRTSYYKRDWGFCLTHKQFLNLNKNEKFEVVINSKLTNGEMNYADTVVKGKSDREFIVSSYLCHPSMANDNLSGVVLWIILLKILKSFNLNFSYRFVLVPETIGAIAYLHKNKSKIKKVDSGFVLSCVAGPGDFAVKQSFQKNSVIDLVTAKAFIKKNQKYTLYPFDLNGSDERQYSAPAFRIPTVTIAKDKYYEYDYYHTSLDNLDFIGANHLISTLKIYLQAILLLEMNLTYISKSANCEPQLGKRGLYPNLGGSIKQKAARSKVSISASIENEVITGEDLELIKWIMFYTDGSKSLLEISELLNEDLEKIYKIAKLLESKKLLERKA